MSFKEKLIRLARKLRFDASRGKRPVTGLIAAVVSLEANPEGRPLLTQQDEDEIVARLRQAVAAKAGGEFDGAERSSTHIQWFFFGNDVQSLEEALLAELRREPYCKGGILRLTSNGVAGPWREIAL